MKNGRQATDHDITYLSTVEFLKEGFKYTHRGIIKTSGTKCAARWPLVVRWAPSVAAFDGFDHNDESFKKIGFHMRLIFANRKLHAEDRAA